MKAKALDSFRAAEVGMVHAGQTFDISHISEDRLRAWDERGLIAPVEDDQPAAEPVKSQPAPLNKAERAPRTKEKKNAKQG